MPDLTLPQRRASRLRSGFLPVLPSFMGLRIYREPWQNLTGPPRHSHSIVAGAFKYLTLLFFLTADNRLTVRYTAKNFRLSAIDGDRCRKGSKRARANSTPIDSIRFCTFISRQRPRADPRATGPSLTTQLFLSRNADSAYRRRRRPRKRECRRQRALGSTRGLS